MTITILVDSKVLVVATILWLLLASIALNIFFGLVVIYDRLQVVLDLSSVQRGRVLAHIRTHFHMLR